MFYAITTLLLRISISISSITTASSRSFMIPTTFLYDIRFVYISILGFGII